MHKHFNIKLADEIFDISTNYNCTYEICKEFEVFEPASISIAISLEDLDDEIEIAEKKMGIDSPSRVHIENIALFRKVVLALIDYGVLLLHGAAIGFRDQGYIFTAPSGTGKTTHILKWIDNLPEAFVVNGDKPFVKISNGNGISNAYICGSPWAGKENLYTNAKVPLKAIILMQRSELNRIKKISFLEAFPALLSQVHIPSDEEKMLKTLKLMAILNSAVSFYSFEFNNFSDDCFDVAFNELYC